ncbi:hypothetical protein PHYBLDRAFT_149855 [Phycomyces blakesleeanus NRRL 1555(-)]|uniref:Uncharacterized protein n=1 Tax=Phycomyces blakesleeanus (strain ATCC 8743b / DSM 1359 / FGSC 10004 / NBRC 33097 / NRRL 1555) TaxID=763407 RepID=A0A162WLH7_PHYB8|nr:hypothetical protein PHYBLDRAFT_149855 [Phycomyces blakesleeanus NRRL 1555(-)]OAD68845.1 hypothetical protein PHYBLDRAFT_149855 [Phycomyces blakesleeanus NRRL 1555(-)]|eukprot:XP_018286885.1 hypothetical protein PHYBLDRAFT_149855 [Phycomyces blakesleeanus NRRL 1555(-)]
MNTTFINTNSIHQNVLNMISLQGITISQDVSQLETTLTIDVVHYAVSPLNSGRTGCGGSPPQERYIHFDNMKKITLSNPSFFLLMLMETNFVADKAVAKAVISICQDNSVTYENTQLTTPFFVSER